MGFKFKKRKPRKHNFDAKALSDPKYRPKVIPDKRRKAEEECAKAMLAVGTGWFNRSEDN